MTNAATLQSMLSGQKQPPFFNKLNLWSITDQVAVGVDLQMSAGLELTQLPDILLQEPDERDQHFQGITQLLHTVPENTTLQFVIKGRSGDAGRVNEYVELQSKENADDPLSQLLLKAKSDDLSGKFILRRRYYLFITTYAVTLEELPRVQLHSLFDKPVKDMTQEMHDKRVAALNGITLQAQAALQNLQISSRRLTDTDLGAYFFEHLNPVSSDYVPCPDLDPNKWFAQHFTARSLLVKSASDNRYDGFRIDNCSHQAVNLLLLPEDLEVGHLDRFSQALWPDYDLCLAIHVVDSERLIEKLKRTCNIARALSFSNFGSHYEAQQQHVELDELIRETRATTQKLFTCSFSVLFRDRDVQALEQKALVGMRSFQELGQAGGIIDHLLHEDLYLAALPNHSHLNSRRHVMHTKPLARLIPLHAPWQGTREPKILLENPQGELVNLDLFDPSLPAKSAILVGSTGSGKSFFTNYLLNNFLNESERNHVVILDVGGSYRKLCELRDGQYLEVDISERYGFNPFPCKDTIFDGKKYDAGDLAYLTLILERMVVDQDESLNSAGEMLLENAIKAAYQQTPSPCLMDIRRRLEEYKGDGESIALARHFARNLALWTEGRYAPIFNSKNRLQTNNRLIVFDLQKLDSHPRLQSVYFYVIRQILDLKLRDRNLRKVYVVDEGHRFFNDDLGSRQIDQLARTIRKFNGMTFMISQSLVDFLKTKAADGIITNAYIKYVLKLTKGHEHLPSFEFNAAEIDAIKNLSSVPRKFSDVFVKFNKNSTTLRLEPCPLEYWICTTDPDDLVREQTLRKEHPDWPPVQFLTQLAQAFAEKPS